MSKIEVNKNNLKSSISDLELNIQDLCSKMEEMTSTLSSVPGHDDFPGLTSATSLISSNYDNISIDINNIKETINNYVEALDKIESEEVEEADVPELESENSGLTTSGDSSVPLNYDTDDYSYDNTGGTSVDNVPVSDGSPVRYSVGGQEYVVQDGDTLYDIASRYGVSVEAIVSANNISDANLINTGQVLVIPSASYDNTGGTVYVSEDTSSDSSSNPTVTPSEPDSSENSVEVDGEYRGVKLSYSGVYNVCDSPLTASMGVKMFEGHKETYYSQRVLPGEGLNIPGRHVADDGTVRDGDGYIVVAADLNVHPRYSVVMCSLGPAKVYDTGSFADSNHEQLDIYVDW